MTSRDDPISDLRNWKQRVYKPVTITGAKKVLFAQAEGERRMGGWPDSPQATGTVTDDRPGPLIDQQARQLAPKRDVKPFTIEPPDLCG